MLKSIDIGGTGFARIDARDVPRMTQDSVTQAFFERVDHALAA